jgi:Tol biopolymer transport system component
MAAIIPGFEYDIFISYRQNDNKRDSWVTKFVEALRDELDATLKEQVTIYFDENPHDGLHEHHEVDDSLREKLKCLILIPVVSQTFCDPKSFAWEHEFKVFVEMAGNDQFGLKTKLSGGNVANRVLPIRIHDLDKKDVELFEAEIGGAIRPIDFIYKETGVNRPLLPEDNRSQNQEATGYRNQVNKVANAIKEILQSLQDEADDETDRTSKKPDKILVEKEQKGLPKKAADKRITREKIRLSKMVIYRGLAGVVILVGLAAAFFIGRNSYSEPVEESLFVLTYDLPLDLPLTRTGRHAMDISANGEFLVIVKGGGFFMESLIDPGAPVPIAGTDTEYHRSPEISPDGKWICFEDVRSGIMKLPINGGTPSLVCKIESAYGINWIGDRIYFANEGSIYRVSDTGGDPERIYPLNEDDIDTLIWNPTLLPDNKTLLFNQSTGTNLWDIRTWQLGSNENAKILVSRGIDVQYLNSGYISYVDDGRLHIASFNYENHSLGNPVIIASNLPVLSMNSRTSQYTLSQNGILVYSLQTIADTYHTSWVDKNGTIEEITQNTFYYRNPKLSPENQQIAVEINNFEEGTKHESVLILNSKLGTSYVLSDDAEGPVWNADGKSVFYETEDNQIVQHFLDMGIESRIIADFEDLDELGNMDSDGRYLPFVVNQNLGYYNLAEDTVIMMDYYNTDSYQHSPSLSPDGKWLVYETGDQELYVVPFPGPGIRYKLSTTEGHYAVWAPDMSAIYYIEHGIGGSDLWKVKINTDDEFTAESPVSLFSGHYWSGYAGKFDIHPNGDKFLMITEAGGASIPKIRVIANWQELLKDN